MTAKVLIAACPNRSTRPVSYRTGLFAMKPSQTLLALTLLAILCGFSLDAQAQAMNPLPDAPSAMPASDSTTKPAVDAPHLGSNYTRPDKRTRVNNFVFDAFGPYPIAGSLAAAGINQWTNSPPEWNQGLKGYSRRFGSDFGIVIVGTTTRYALAEALKEDTLYYRCDCTGILPRSRHALLSSLTARKGSDGHRVFSLPALIAPYAGNMAAVYGWYPNRFGAKDALRMGSYNLLIYAGGNLSLEFFYSGPHSLLSRMHLNNSHGSPDPGPNHPGPGAEPPKRTGPTN